MLLNSLAARALAAVLVTAGVILTGACNHAVDAGSTGAGKDSGGSKIIRGIATVVDGDGVEIDGVKIRLFGIDAPETGQYCYRAQRQRWRCGQYATVELDRLAAGKTLDCAVRATDRYDRPVAVCRVDGRDLAEHLVASGWALAYRRYSKDYVDEEERAKRAKLGIWAGTFEPPWDWRKRMTSKDRR